MVIFENKNRKIIQIIDYTSEKVIAKVEHSIEIRKVVLNNS